MADALMIKHNKAVKLRLYPTRPQKEYFSKVFGCTRKVYNLALAECVENYKLNGKFTHQNYSAYYNDYPFLKDVEAQALSQSLQDLNTAFKNRFSKTAKRQTGFPRFKSKKNRQSYRTCMPSKTALGMKTIKIPKIGAVKFRAKPRVEEDWELKSITISRTKSGKYYASLLYEFYREEPDVKLDLNNSIGLDYKSNGLFTDNQGNSPSYPRYYRRLESKLAREQRRLSHMVRGSANYEKQKTKIARVHEKIANQRKDFMHKLSYNLAEKYDYIFIEDINLQDISQHLNLGKSTYDNSFGLFRTLLSYKMGDRGKVLHKIDKWYASSKTCSICGSCHPEIVNSLAVRKWICPNCGSEHDRDINAASNMRNKGILEIKTVGTTGIACLCSSC